MSLEAIKAHSRHLRGSLAAELAGSSPRFGEESAQLLKFHGVYQQDDRDLRRGRDRVHVMMVRAAVPGGRLLAEQYLVADQLADLVGDGTIRITSRQGLQWHKVAKADLPRLIWVLNQAVITTFGACGDVVRNTVACPDPGASPILAQVAEQLATRFRPRSRAYWELWVDGERAVSAETDEEPVYGAGYLPRKFKIGVTAPGDNCVDLFTHDLGFAAVEEGWVVVVGGGQGRSHNRPDTYPRLADPLATVATDEIGEVAQAVVEVQRDWGERSDRKRARLKYLIDSWGLDRFRAAVEERLGRRLHEPTPLHWRRHTDHLGAGIGADGSSYLGVAVPSGRVQGNFRSALRRIVETYRPDLRLTPQQNLILEGLDAEARREAARDLASDRTTLRLLAMACVALPTCGLALTDAERALPEVAAQVASVLRRVGLEEDAVTVRITGCPNGCARPYTAEIGLVGRREGRYDIHLGAAADGTRLGERVFEMVPLGEVGATLDPLLTAWKAGGDELRFGDFCHRIGTEELARIGEAAVAQ